MGFREYRVFKVFKGDRELREFKEHRERKEQSVTQALGLKAYKVLGVIQPELSITGPLILPTRIPVVDIFVLIAEP